MVVRRTFLGLAKVCVAAGLSLACSPTAGQTQPRPRERDSLPRIVSLHEMTSDMLVQLGAASQLVGVSEPVDGAPETLQALALTPRVSSIESVLALKPDLVVSYAIVQRHEPELFARLKQANITTLVYDPKTPDELRTALHELGQAVGQSERSRDLSRQLDDRLARAQAVLHGQRFFVYDCCDPPLTAGGATLLSAALREAGAHNVFGTLAADWVRVSWEDAVIAAPDFVIITDYNEASLASKRQQLARFPSLARAKQVVIPLREALAGPRLAAGLERVIEGVAQR